MSAFGGRAMLAQAAPLARVTGAVYDSLASQPMVDALVQLVAEDNAAQVRSTRTDAAGRFSFDSVIPRSYVIGVLHPRVDALLLQPPTRRLTVRAGTVAEGSLSLPSARTLRGAYCGANAAHDTSTAVFVGRLRRAGEARTSTTGRVRAEWAEYVIDEKGRRNEVQGVEAIANGDGAFALCGLPGGATVAVRAWAGSDSSGVVELTAPRDGLLQRDLLVGGAGITRSGQLRGTVRRGDGVPVAGARVALSAHDASAITNSEGMFALRELPLGTHALETQAIGLAPQRTPVDIVDSVSGTPVEIVLALAGQEIDTVRVNASRVPLADRWLTGFEERRKLGHGHFVDEATIERLNPSRVTDLLRATPGVRVTPSPFNPAKMRVVFTRHLSNGGYCPPDIYIDGVLLNNTEREGVDIELVVSPREVRSMEVYTSAVNRPAQFSAASGCGTIVLWRGMRKLTP
ncbi:MAG: carboxypeptidase regulatory-like domain-containing protein [Gemmatimonadota bacterium]